jgi:nucleotide-binding universal stress UspA family protein
MDNWPAIDTAMLPFRLIFHPTDFSTADQAAFAHALKLTYLVQGELTMMHVDPTVGRQAFEDFPRIRPLLARWGVLPEGSSKDDVAKLGVKIKRVRAVSDDTPGAILQHLTAHPTELLVLSTHQREGLARLTHRPVAEPVARGTHAKTLFVPAGVEGFISAETGRTNLTRVLIPLADKPDPQPAIDFAANLASTLDSKNVLFELIHIGKENDPQKFTHPERPGWSWNTIVAKGDPAEWILAAGADFDVDLIVMATERHTGLIDLIRGSTTERVVRGTRCPLLAIPTRPDLPVLAP